MTLVTPYIAATPLGAVLVVFAATLGLALVRTLPALVTFYAWFRRSGLGLTEHRGYGQSACSLYGACR